MVYTFDDAKAKNRHKTQYFEIFGNRAHLPRRLAGPHRPSRRLGDSSRGDPCSRTSGNSTHVDEDFSPANDLAAKNPAKLKELQELFLEGGGQIQVLPLDDRQSERTNADLVGRPDLMAAAPR